jgi:hypothetical protein
MGKIYQSQRRYKEAEVCYRFATQLYEQVLGADDPATVQARMDLEATQVKVREEK